MREIAADPRVLTTTIDQCAYGLKSKDKDGEGPAKKPTKFLTNSIGIRNELMQRCPGCSRHVQLMEGRAKAAQRYPQKLCRAVTRGIVNQAKMDAADLFALEVNELVELMKVDGTSDSMDQVEHDAEEWRSSWDDISGEKLDPKFAREARMEEIRGIHQMKVYRKVPITMCMDETGKRPIGTRWVDTNKGDRDKPNVRCRLVAQEINRFKCPELFAATPPMEFIRYLISRCASSQWGGKPSRIMTNDVKKAYFNAPATRRVFVALPPEDTMPGEEDQCALLLKSLYGTRDAAYNWTQAYTKVLTDMGFAKGESSPCSFWHEQKGIATVVHGDDFCSEGCAESLKWMKGQLEKSFEIKTNVLGPDPEKGESREIRFLNRVLTWQDWGIDWEADPRHAELVIQQLGLEGCRPVVTPGVKEEPKKDVDDERSAEKRATRTDEPAQGQKCKDEEAKRHAPKAKPQDISEVLEKSGWSRNELGGFTKSVQGATCLEVPDECKRGTRVVRDAVTGALIDELSFDSRTARRRKMRQLKCPRDVVTEVFIDAMSELDEDGDRSVAEMSPKDASLYRAITARINFLALDRADLQYSSKECSRRMSAPRIKDWLLLKRVGRYLAGRPRAVSTFRWQDSSSTVTAYSDSDWAGCRDTRKSTSGACFLIGGHLLKSYSRTQSNIALSSAEAELYSFATAASEALGLKSMSRDLGVKATCWWMRRQRSA